MIFRTLIRLLCPLDFLTLCIMSNDAPDTSRADAVAEKMAGLSDEQFAWVKDIYEKEAPAREAAAARANAVSDAQLEAMKMATGASQDILDYQNRVFRPIEQSIASEAMNFDTEARREEAAGKAVADVTGAFAGQRDATMRGMTRSGFAPTSATVAAMRGMMDSEEALGKVAAAEAARERVGTIGRAMKADAANLGRGIASSQATQAGLATSSGGVAASTGLAALQPGQQAQAAVGSGFNQAMNGMGGAANIYGNSASLHAKAGDNSGAMAGIGAAAGGIIMAI